MITDLSCVLVGKVLNKRPPPARRERAIREVASLPEIANRGSHGAFGLDRLASVHRLLGEAVGSQRAAATADGEPGAKKPRRKKTKTAPEDDQPTEGADPEPPPVKVRTRRKKKVEVAAEAMDRVFGQDWKPSESEPVANPEEREGEAPEEGAR